jgi:hypothetical protein
MVRKLLILAVVVSALTTVAGADLIPIYREIFFGDVERPMSQEGWTGNFGATAQEVPSDTTAAYRGAASGGKQDPTNIGDPLNSNDNYAGTKRAYGFLFLDNETQTGPVNTMVWTSEYPVAQAGLQKFSWYLHDYRDAGSPGGVITQTLAVKIGGAWYASTTNFSNNDYNGWLKVEVNFSTAGSNWKAFDFTPGASLDQDLSDNAALTGSLPSGTIDAFGIYVKMGGPKPANGYWARIDTFEIFTPEPATMSLLAVGAAAMLRRNRK